MEIIVVPVHTVNAYGSGDISPLILNFSTVFAGHISHKRKSPWSALDRRIGCLHSQSGYSGEETILLPSLRIEP